MKSIVMFLLVLGMLMISAGYHQSLQDNFKVQKVIEYRYVPRSFYEEQMQPVNLVASFKDMFEKDNIFLSR